MKKLLLKLKLFKLYVYNFVGKSGAWISSNGLRDVLIIGAGVGLTWWLFDIIRDTVTANAITGSMVIGFLAVLTVPSIGVLIDRFVFPRARPDFFMKVRDKMDNAGSEAPVGPEWREARDKMTDDAWKATWRRLAVMAIASLLFGMVAG